MFKTVMLIGFLALNVVCFTQNGSYQLFNDSIYPLLEKGEYSQAKTRLKSAENKADIDPINKLLFLEHSLIHDDLKYFKKEIITLIKYYGYNYNSDVGFNKSDSRFNQLIVEKGMGTWLDKKSRKYYPFWVKNHFNQINYFGELRTLKTRDQNIRGYSFALYPLIIEDFQLDTFAIEFRKTYDSLIDRVDLDNIEAIRQMCIHNNGNLPTNFDSGIGVTEIITLIVSHNLKRGTNLRITWEYVYPYIEKAYSEGKISSSLLYDFDYNLNLHYGVQYYGTLEEDVPRISSDELKKM